MSGSPPMSAKNRIKHSSMSLDYEAFQQKRGTEYFLETTVVLAGEPTERGRFVSDVEMSETSFMSSYMLPQGASQSEKEMLIQMRAMDADQWEWDHVKVWLKSNNFEELIDVLDLDKKGLDGDELLHIQFDDFMTKYHYKELSNIGDIKENSKLKHLMKLITKLKLAAESDENLNNRKEHCDVSDYFEIKRRLQMFQNKWDKILWIDYYLDKYDSKPSAKILSEEQGVSMEIAEAYMKIYDGDKAKLLSKDLDELLQGFNPYNDCVLFWAVIIALLKVRSSESLFHVFARVAEISPGSVSIKLLNKYKLELSRYETEKVDQITQNVVIGSKYPVCAALRISTWFKDRASYDVSRAEEWIAISESYIEAAVDYLSNIRSDHFATILLECKSDIENRSALDMALDYRLTSFVKNNRVERVATSIMNDFEFLKIENIDEAFEIDEINLHSLIDKLEKPQFYFTPLGTFITELALYIVYLALFTYLSINEFNVYDEMAADEVVFWVLNMGYVFNEAQALISDGLSEYFEDATNYMDVCISLLFCTSLTTRIMGSVQGPGCVTAEDATRECYSDSSLYTMFIIMWSLSTMLLWLRLFTFMILSHSLGPMVQMILRMMKDIGTFFKIMLVLFLGFAMCLMYVLQGVHDDFASPFTSVLTLLRAILGDFDFGAFAGADDVNDSLLYYGIGVMLIYLVIGSLVFLNLLIAMMAKTFDTIQDDTTSAIVFSRFQLAMMKDNSATFMPAPLNVIAFIFFALFYLCETLMKCCCAKADLAITLMPPWMKKRNLEIDDQIVNKKCVMETNEGDDTECRITGYRQEIMKHNVEFDKRVCVGDSIMVQKKWLLDLWELADEGSISFDQFYTNVDAEWTYRAHQSINKDGTRSPYWICRYCRGYVKRSSVSIKRLGRLLRVSDLEMKLILSHAPEICPSCYRHREECERWQLVAEIISARMFEPLRWIMLFLLRAIAFVLKYVFQVSDENDNDDEDSDDEDDDESLCVPNHIYEDPMLLQQLKKYEADEDDDLFNLGEKNVIWKTLIKAKENVEDSLLKMQIESHIMNKSIEDDHSYFEFKDDFVEFDQFLEFDANAWKEYFEKFSRVIFDTIKEDTSAKQPLQLFARYPFDVHMVLDEFDDWWEKEEIVNEKKKSLKDCEPDDDDFRRMLHQLNLFHSQEEEIDAQLKIILDDVVHYDEEMQSNDKEKKSFYSKFIHYLYRVQSLFQNPRKINNLIRDANRAIVERGVTEYVFEDELYLLFEDIADASEALPFFNAMRSEKFGDEQKVGLWTLLNTLKCLYFLHHCVKEQVLTQNARIYVDKKDLLRLVFDKFREEIVDPDGILEEYDTDEEKKKPPQQEATEAIKENNEEDDGKQEEKENNEAPNDANANLDDGTINDDNINQMAENTSTQMKNEKAKLKETRELRKRRVALFSKSEITARAIKREIETIYDRIKEKRKSKITVTNIDFFRRQMHVKLLADEVSMNYIVNQLSRYATFYAEETKNVKCTFARLYNVLTNTKSFVMMKGKSKSYRIDDQMIPKFCNNLSYVRQLYQHLCTIYTAAAKQFSDKLDDSHPNMTILDVLSIILIYDRVFEETDKQMEDISDTFIVSHDVFCKFVDNDYKIGVAESDSIEPKAQIASDLYQSVLDVQQNFVTLGEAYQTILKFINDIDGMKCGEPFRIMSWIKTKKKRELDRYDEFRRKWTEKHGTDHGNLQALSEKERTTLIRENPAITFDHVDKTRWKEFVRKISKGLIDNKPCDDFISEYNIGTIKEEDSSAIRDDEEKGKERPIIDTIHEFTKLDIISDDVEQEEKEKEEKKDQRKRSTRSQRSNVFKTMLQFNADRITLQQFFEFSYKMYLVVRRNKNINDLMEEYEAYIANKEEDKAKNDAFEKQMEQTFADVKACRQMYFDGDHVKWTESVNLKYLKEEIEWFADGTRDVGALCRRLHPFWSLNLTKSIHEFLESTELINGTYELKAAEFKQFKHELHVNDALAHDLFHLIRFKQRSLSWEQCRRFFAFLLQQRYRIKKAILDSTELEDTTISKDALKTTLEISSNDEAKWLFNKVEQIHGAKVTWKQVRNYLEKMVSVRVSMRDFFSDQQRDREFKENHAEEFHNAVEEERERGEGTQTEIDKLKQTQNQILQNQKKILDMLMKSQPDSQA
eukprot:483245_1